MFTLYKTFYIYATKVHAQTIQSDSSSKCKIQKEELFKVKKKNYERCNLCDD